VWLQLNEKRCVSLSQRLPVVGVNVCEAVEVLRRDEEEKKKRRRRTERRNEEKLKRG